MNLPKSLQNATPGVNCDVNYWLGAEMMCQWRFIQCNKHTSLVWGVDSIRGYGGVRARIYGNSLYFFCCESKTSLKHSLLVGKKKYGHLFYSFSSLNVNKFISSNKSWFCDILILTIKTEEEWGDPSHIRADPLR